MRRKKISVRKVHIQLWVGTQEDKFDISHSQVILERYGAMLERILNSDDKDDDSYDDNDDHDDDDRGGYVERCVGACWTLVSRCFARFMLSYYLLGFHSLMMMMTMIIIRL